MCTIMVVDNSQTTRNWVYECIQKSNIKIGKIVLCATATDAEKYISQHDIDIVFTHIDKKNPENIELVKSMRKKLLFSVVLGYGRCKDCDFLCSIITNGVSQYIQDVYDIGKLFGSLNDAYERYCTSKIKLDFITEQAKGRLEKAYSDWILRQLVDAYARNAAIGSKKNVNEYIDMVLDIMDRQSLCHSKNMSLELMIIITERVTSGRIRTDFALYNSKYYASVMSLKTVSALKELVRKYLENLAKNIHLLSNAKDCKSISLISATDYIKENYHLDISRDDVASAVNLNPSYFSKFFKEQMGESYVAYLRRIRLERAKAYLETSEEAIKDISVRVGYSDDKYFSKLFFDYTGHTPCEYRRCAKKQMA